MTQKEARSLMLQGHKLKHKYFTADEWVTYDKMGRIVTEEGYRHNSMDFWYERRGEQFQTDWELWTDAKTSTK